MDSLRLDIFNTSIYKEMINTYEKNLSNLKKYVLINEKMIDYYLLDEIKYIVETYSNILIDLINSNLFKLFVTGKAYKEVQKLILPIPNLIKSKNFNRIISKFEDIKRIIYIEI